MSESVSKSGRSSNIIDCKLGRSVFDACSGFIVRCGDLCTIQVDGLNCVGYLGRVSRESAERRREVVWLRRVDFKLLCWDVAD